MKIILHIFFLLGLWCFPLRSYSQNTSRPIYDTTTRQGVRLQAALSGLVSTSSQTPFWLRSNEFGIIPLESPAGILSLSATGLWGDATQSRKPYLKAGIEAVGNLTRNSRFVLPQAYAAIRLGHAELYGGRRKEINGLTDTLLTSGSYAYSGNAIPITQIRIGTKDYAPLKFTAGIVSLNAFFSHGWFSNTDSMQHVYLHAKALYVRIGKPTWKVRFYGGMSHYAQWGGYSKYLGPLFAKDGHLTSGWEGFKQALWPNEPNPNNGKLTSYDSLNRGGNHLGSIDIALEVNLAQTNVLFYVQRPWEDMSGVVFGNLPDGLYGLRWQNRNLEPIQGFRLTNLTGEFMTTTNQSGATFPKGYDEYFVNMQYLDGWTHQKRVIGTPFFTRWMDSDPRYHHTRPTTSFPSVINNNSVRLLHVGIMGRFASGLSVTGLLSQSWNYGHPHARGLTEAAKQFSGIVSVSIPRSRGWDWKVSLALDQGHWLPSNLSGMITLRKTAWL